MASKVEAWVDDSGVVHKTEAEAREGDEWHAYRRRVSDFMVNTPGLTDDDGFETSAGIKFRAWLLTREGKAAVRYLANG